MKYGRLTETIVNVVLDTPIIMGNLGDKVIIHESFGTHYEISTEAKPSLTFYATKSQIELI